MLFGGNSLRFLGIPFDTTQLSVCIVFVYRYTFFGVFYCVRLGRRGARLFDQNPFLQNRSIPVPYIYCTYGAKRSQNYFTHARIGDGGGIRSGLEAFFFFFSVSHEDRCLKMETGRINIIFSPTVPICTILCVRNTQYLQGEYILIIN